MALSFRRNGDGSFGVTLPLHDRSLLEALVPQMRELITQHDPDTWRLFPNPYPKHEKAADEYAELIGDDLKDRHIAALTTVEETLDAKRLDEDQMIQWMSAINHLRLFMGTFASAKRSALRCRACGLEYYAQDVARLVPFETGDPATSAAGAPSRDTG